MLTGSVPPDRIRATDAERRGTVERLSHALGEGCVSVTEFEVRAANAWAATTRGDLSSLTEDLPPYRPILLPVPRTVGHPGLRAMTATWAVLSLVAVVTSVVLGGLANTWWIWVVGPGGAVMSILWWVDDHRRRPGA